MNHLAFININLLIFLLSSKVPSGFAAEKFQEDGLKLHNELRAKHGTPPLILDEALNQVAKICAEYYLTGKDSHTCPGAEPYGENIGMLVTMVQTPGVKAEKGGGNDAGFEKHMTSSIGRWYDERKRYNYDEPKKSRGMTGHFTQLMWRETKKLGLGCAVGTGEEEFSTYCVALYDPAGNLKGSYEKNVAPPNRIFVQAEPESKAKTKVDSAEVLRIDAAAAQTPTAE